MPLFFSNPWLGQVLADPLVDPVKPLEGELDWSAEKPDDTRHILVDEVDPVPCFEDSDSLKCLPTSP